MKKRTLFLGLLLVFSAILIAGCTQPKPAQLPATPNATPAATTNLASLTGCEMLKADQASATPQIMTGMRNMSFCELITLCADGTGALYGSAKLNDPGDPCPERLWTPLTSAQVMKQYNLTKADKNPPYGPNPPIGRKFWTLDELKMNTASTVRLFNGNLQMVWWATVGDEGEIQPYNPMMIGRDSVITFRTGNTVNLLTDSNGTIWIEKNYITTPQTPMTYEQLPTLKTLLKYPAGWTFRSKTLDKDLILLPVDGKARIMWDDRDQSWDALDPGVSNYLP